MSQATVSNRLWQPFFASVVALALLVSNAAFAGQPKQTKPSDHDELQPEDPATKNVVVQGSGKTIRILKIGNSFSQNATEYLSQLAAAQGNTIVWGRAEIGGCPMQKHYDLAMKHESNPDDVAGKPYAGSTPGTKTGLREILQSQPWDIVTMQQYSLWAPDIKTYRPSAKQLSDYVRKYAPTAKIWLHETWAYRADDKIFKKDLTQSKMYQNIHDAYETIGQEIQAEKIIPCATAFQNARKDPRWQLELEKDIDLTKYTFPELPKQVHALCVGYKWDTKTKKIAFDGKHCTIAGKYLAALVWNETFFGPSTKPEFVPQQLAAADAVVLQDIARKTVRDGLKP